MNSMSFAITSLVMPELSSEPKNAVHDGSTPLDVKPSSASYPMCATWTNDPEVGADIKDLSILPLFDAFFFFSVCGFADICSQ
jgi:hypothetical protein